MSVVVVIVAVAPPPRAALLLVLVVSSKRRKVFARSIRWRVHCGRRGCPTSFLFVVVVARSAGLLFFCFLLFCFCVLFVCCLLHCGDRASLTFVKLRN